MQVIGNTSLLGEEFLLLSKVLLPPSITGRRDSFLFLVLQLRAEDVSDRKSVV